MLTCGFFFKRKSRSTEDVATVQCLGEPFITMEQFAAGVRDREIIFPNESGAYDLSSNYRLPPAIVDELTEELFPLEGPPQRGSSLDKLPMDTSPGNRLPNRVLLHERVTSRRDLTSGRSEGRSTIDIGGRRILRVQGIIRRYLLPDLGRLPIQSIEESYLFSVLKPVYDKGLKESARRTRAIAAQIFTYGKDTQRCTNNPARDMAGNSYFKKPVPKHFAAIDQSDVPKLMADLRKTGAEQRLKPQTVCALLMVIYTGHRDHAVRGAKWKEFDLVNHVWEVPAERMKNRNSHGVTLPSQAVQALSAIRPITFKDPDSFVFSSKSKTGYISENTLRLALHRLGYKVTVHGFRTLITTVLNEHGFNADAIERQLDHVEKNAVRRAYLRSDFDELRRSTMQWFADWCDAQPASQNAPNVINISLAR